MILTNAQINFFWVEIENEKMGGISPATLDSAIDSLKQAPNSVVVSWCDDLETVYDDDSVCIFCDSIEGLRDNLGGNTQLIDLVY